jgi:hypothetical protein
LPEGNGNALPSLAAGAPTPTGDRRTARSAPTTDIGEIAGAPFRIDVPVGWNGGLVMYCHGYRGAPVRFDAHRPDAIAQMFRAAGVRRGAVGIFGGRLCGRRGDQGHGGLRVYFGSHVGPPKKTWVNGSSLGGSVTMMLESYPTTYDDGLALSAAAAGGAPWRAGRAPQLTDPVSMGQPAIRLRALFFLSPSTVTWFRSISHPGLAAAAQKVGAAFIWRSSPPLFSRPGLDDIDVVIKCDGLRDFDSEYSFCRRARTRDGEHDARVQGPAACLAAAPVRCDADDRAGQR